MKIFRILVTACALALLAPLAAQGDPPAVVGFGQPSWVVSGLSAHDIDEAYPEAARQLFLEGQVYLTCTVLRARRLDCVVESENPPDQGFGAAALRVAANVRIRSPEEDARLQIGRQVRVPIRFALQD